LSIVTGANDPVVVEGVEGKVHDDGAVDEDRGDPVRNPSGLGGLEDGDLAARSGQWKGDAIGVG
jgi:hypothetical protein